MNTKKELEQKIEALVDNFQQITDQNIIEVGDSMEFHWFISN